MYIISLPLHHTSIPSSPFSPSLISLMVSVDVKHNVYLLTYHANISRDIIIASNSKNWFMTAFLRKARVVSQSFVAAPKHGLFLHSSKHDSSLRPCSSYTYALLNKIITKTGWQGGLEGGGGGGGCMGVCDYGLT